MRRKSKFLVSILISSLLLSTIGFTGVAFSGQVPVRRKDTKKAIEKLYHPSQLIVRFKKGVSARQKNAVLKSAGTAKVLKKGRSGLELIELKKGVKPEKVLKSLKTSSGITQVELNRVYRKDGAPIFEPADAYFPYQWGLHNTGQTIPTQGFGTYFFGPEKGEKDSDIDAVQAWNLEPSSNKIVAVIDTGVDLEHPELINNLWENVAEVGGVDGEDDDSNGFVDDFYGANFAGITMEVPWVGWDLGQGTRYQNYAQSIRGTGGQLSQIKLDLLKVKSPSKGITVSVSDTVAVDAPPITASAEKYFAPEDIPNWYDYRLGLKPDVVLDFDPVDFPKGSELFVRISTENSDRFNRYELLGDTWPLSDEDTPEDLAEFDSYKPGALWHRETGQWQEDTTSDLSFMTNPNSVPQDDNGHGTHVAGIIAAENDDSDGTVGVAPGTKIMSIKVLDSLGMGYLFDVVEGIYYAVDNNADVINLSLGGMWSPSLQTATSYAINNGVVVVAAAGNDGEEWVDAPAQNPGVIAVGATDIEGGAAYFTNWGSGVDIYAPGQDILSTWWDWDKDNDVPTSGYRYLSGTSQASPMVAGAVSLFLNSNVGTPAEIDNLLANTAVKTNVVSPESGYYEECWQTGPNSYTCGSDEEENKIEIDNLNLYGLMDGPVLRQVSPAEGSETGRYGSILTLGFSKAMDTTSFAGNIRLFSYDWEKYINPQTISYDAGKRVARFTPQLPIVLGGEYHGKVSSAISDDIGQQLDEGKEWDFTASRIAEENEGILYSSAWTNANHPLAIGKALRRTNKANSYAIVDFVGDEMKLTVMKGPYQGVVNAYVNGMLMKSFDLYYPVDKRFTLSLPLFWEDLYRLKLVVAGKKNVNSKGYWVSLDRFNAPPPPEDDEDGWPFKK